ncbi:hypothetical protein H072_4092 [Dactylellina haptotyla CBS 200.50]|uniref:Acyltransferase MbtK/IucB-like conserved domain-containing protein n=1 Tax=Dactylellina haptotyla (strain CBS 200.50) TaxID=1284197 RepID=S8BR64_DACHA|nr:hypothetical protein H072_4092 [Dactylellina haptotyla CBS 200.50]
MANVLYLPTDPPAAVAVELEISHGLQTDPSVQPVDVIVATISTPHDPQSPQTGIRTVTERGVPFDRLIVHLPTSVNGTQDSSVAREIVWIALYWHFQYTDRQQSIPKGKPVPRKGVQLVLESASPSVSAAAIADLEQFGLVEIAPQVGGTVPLVFSTSFWQTTPESYLSRHLNAHRYFPNKPLRYTLSNGAIRHPKRPLPPLPSVPFYTRHCISGKVNSVFRLRPVDINDLDLIHKWMNNPRVAEFWGEQGPIEHQQQFLKNCLLSQHSFAAIGSWNDLDADGNLTAWRDACFFDIYWVKEDHLARYTNNVQDWDRGVHLLVGEDWARGRSKAWLDCIVHYMFLADSRTESIYLEPRVDNEL